MRKSSEGSYPLIIAGKSGPPRVLDVTVVLIDGDHPSTAIAPIEVFNSAGQLWNALHGRAVQPRFRVRVASVDGAEVNSVCSLKLQPECGITLPYRHHHRPGIGPQCAGPYRTQFRPPGLAQAMAFSGSLHCRNLHRCRVPRRVWAPRWSQGNHPLGPSRHLAGALPRRPLATRAVRDGRRSYPL